MADIDYLFIAVLCFIGFFLMVGITEPESFKNKIKRRASYESDRRMYSCNEFTKEELIIWLKNLEL